MEPRTRTKPSLTVTPGVSQVSVNVVQWAYRVDYGPGVRPQWHTVSKDRRCQCRLGADCPAVNAVGDYLRTGGERAPDPPFDFWPRVPEACPICGSPTSPEGDLTSREHGLGWRCGKTGLLCYWAARAVPLMLAQPARRYVITPVGPASDVAEDGSPALPDVLEKLKQWVVTIQNQPPAEYPGITAGDMAEARGRAETRCATWAAEGYCPDD